MEKEGEASSNTGHKERERYGKGKISQRENRDGFKKEIELGSKVEKEGEASLNTGA